MNRIVNISIFRGIAILLATLSMYFLTTPKSYHIYVALLFTHYLIGFAFSIKSEKYQEHRWQRLIVFLVLTVLSYVICTQFSIQALGVYFGLHFLLTDLYLPKYLGFEFKDKTLFYLRAAFYFTLYFGITKITLKMYGIDNMPIAYMSLVLFIILTGISLAKKDKTIIFDIPAFICLILAMIYKPFVFYGVIYYHIILWLFIPMFKSKEFGKQSSILHVLIFIPFYYFVFSEYSVSSHFPINEKVNFMAHFWGYLHISYTLATSTMNPEFIRKLTFYRRKTL